jgi:hypothetical protein
MKQASSLAIVLRRILSVLLIISASQTVHARANKLTDQADTIFATSAVGGGRLVIKRSPVLAHDINITMTIDGKLGGAFARGHTYDIFLTPGRHLLNASPNRLRGDWNGILDVRRGHTYVFLARYYVNRLTLDLLPLPH